MPAQSLGFHFQSKLQSHQSHHDNLKDIEKEIECPSCGKVIESRRTLAMHYLKGSHLLSIC